MLGAEFASPGHIALDFSHVDFFVISCVCELVTQLPIWKASGDILNIRGGVATGYEEHCGL